jgi:hypothetical protein
MNFQKAIEIAERELDVAEDHDYYIIIEKNVLVFLFLAAKQKKELFCRSRHLFCQGPWKSSVDLQVLDLPCG